MHHFSDSQRQGEWGAAILDRVISPHWRLEEASIYQERSGIDRIAHTPYGIISLEYKTDFRAHETGNAFIEIDSAQIKGWAITSKADLILYFIPGLAQLFIVFPERVRQRLPAWTKRYRIGGAQNPRYTTRGLLVPLPEVRAVSIFVQIERKIYDPIEFSELQNRSNARATAKA